jgi:DNA-binding response OmpR family regulator
MIIAMKKDARYSLLYVEDEKLIRNVVVEFLQEYFKEIYEAENGVEALNLYKEKKPDIIITDIQMPKMDGLKLCQRIRSDDKTTPIIIISAYSNQEYLLKAVELNLVKYLIKPVSEEQFFEAIELCFDRIESKNPTIIPLGQGYIYDTFNHVLVNNSTIINLTASQSKLLEILIKNRQRVVSYEQLEYEIWYDSAMSKDALRCLVRDIRKATYKEIIENISKVGYRVNIDE